MEWLRDAMAHYIEEEVGHQEWILDDIAACGGDAGAVRAGEPDLPAELLVSYAYDLIHRRNPVGFLGMVLVLEGTSVRVAAAAAEALRSNLGLPKAAFTYLTSHGALDLTHMDFYAGLVNRLEREEDRQAVAHAARRFYRLYGDVFRALPLTLNAAARAA
jgi:pyrroloquinoline quinone (PQQ) biosynthesis protein C